MSDESLKKKIDAFIKSKKGVELAQEAQAKALASDKTLPPSYAAYQQLGNMFMRELKSTINGDPRSSDALKQISQEICSEGNYTVSEFQQVNKGKTFKIGITFNREKLKRKSLLAENGFGERYYTGEGIRNILALFNNGYTISEDKQRDMWDSGHSVSGYAAPYGLWETHNVEVRAKVHRDPLLFMQNSAKSFLVKNKKKFNIKSVTINEEYTKS